MSSVARIAEALQSAIDTQRQEQSVTIEIACECGYGSPASLERVIEHAAFDHSTSRHLVLIRTSVVLSDYQLRDMLDLEPRTEAEEKWRQKESSR